MNTHSLCCIGYITQDKVVTPKNTIYMPGGTSKSGKTRRAA